MGFITTSSFNFKTLKFNPSFNYWYNTMFYDYVNKTWIEKNIYNGFDYLHCEHVSDDFGNMVLVETIVTNKAL